MNFAEFPIALLTDRVPKGQKTIKFEDQIFDEKRKKLITRRRIIEGSEEYGLPTATDDAVILALIQLTKLKKQFHQARGRIHPARTDQDARLAQRRAKATTASSCRSCASQRHLQLR